MCKLTIFFCKFQIFFLNKTKTNTYKQPIIQNTPNSNIPRV